MKIGIDARFIGPQGTGLGKYTEKLILNLARIDQKNRYYIFLKKDNWHYISVPNKNFQKVLADVAWYSFEEQLKMPGIYKGQNLDILHVPHFNVPLLYRESFVVTIHDLIHHKFSQESVTTKNHLIFKTKKFAYKRIIKNAILKSKKIITPSNYVKEEILKTFKVPSGKIIVTYEAAEEEYYQKKQPTEISKKSGLLYVGNTYPHKNLEKLLEAMVRLNTTLKIVCPRDVFLERLKQEIDKKDLKEKVFVLSYQDPQELKKIFQKSSAYVFPSLEEGFGIPGLNAMASGVPVIASNIPTLKEVYGNAAIYFDPRNANDIAGKIQKVLTSKKQQQKLIENGFDQAKKYSWQKMAEKTLTVYENSISPR